MIENACECVKGISFASELYDVDADYHTLTRGKRLIRRRSKSTRLIGTRRDQTFSFFPFLYFTSLESYHLFQIGDACLRWKIGVN